MDIFKAGPDAIEKGDWLFYLRGILLVFNSRSTSCANFYATRIDPILD